MRNTEVIDNIHTKVISFRFRNYMIFATFIMSGIRKQEFIESKDTDG